MKYPQAFVKKVQNEYPTKEYYCINKDLNEQQAILGDSLLHQCGFKIGPEAILEAIKKNNFNGIKKAALTAIRRKKIYAEWEKIYKDYCKANPVRL